MAVGDSVCYAVANDAGGSGFALAVERFYLCERERFAALELCGKDFEAVEAVSLGSHDVRKFCG